MNILHTSEDSLDDEKEHPGLTSKIFDLLKILILTPWGGYIVMRFSGFIFFGFPDRAGETTDAEKKWAAFVNTIFTAQMILEGIKFALPLVTDIILAKSAQQQQKT